MASIAQEKNEGADMLRNGVPRRRGQGAVTQHRGRAGSGVGTDLQRQFIRDMRKYKEPAERSVADEKTEEY